MVRKAIFGGTFDPIHNGHLNIAYESLERLDLDEIIFMPAGDPPHKSIKKITNATLRCEMVLMAIRHEKRFSLDYYEVSEKGISYTYKTLLHFSKVQPEVQWHFITGADCLFYIDTWKNVKELLGLCTLVVFNRLGFSEDEIQVRKEYIEKKYNTKIIVLNTPFLEISSTNIRNRIAADKEVSYLLPSGVDNIIKELGLYRGINNVE